MEEKVLNRKIVNNTVKRKIEDIEGDKPAQKIRKVAEELKKPLSTLTRQDVTFIRNNLYRAKSKTMPKLPKTTEELQTALENITTTTSKGEEFLLVNDRENKIVIFSCDENLKFLSKSETIFMDGTFEYAPKYFLQMFTIHGFSNGVYVPLVFCLLKDKKKQTYIDAMKNVQEECLKRRLQLQPQWIVVDFEQSIHECIKIILPEAKIVGCRFHLGQSWWRKIQNLGLSSVYKDKDSEEGRWLRHFFGLSYLKPEDVEEAFCQLVGTQPVKIKLTSFADYLCDTYIDCENQLIFLSAPPPLDSLFLSLGSAPLFSLPNSDTQISEL
ncbi:uncharacterized protein LOC128985298 [Macrosteles quadrilineatus]|uniref:uncharacterized protein LOC128985298 n=1 Tax=Macrosteles quadrilineatus TaxID=74068 RepID=UPI0023E2ABC1|nr:uncharacterized protein LOC128985298 [Macrosteles quadrilineatus]